MKKMTLEEMQETELNILRVFDELCRKNGLRFFLDGGTLLGAMCYEGFIPWDDDIDLKMPRGDYGRLPEIADQLPDYISLEMPSGKNCQYLFAKLTDNRTVLYENGTDKKTGVYVDVFPMDGFPDDPDEYRAHLKKMSRLNSLFHYSLDDYSGMKNSRSLMSRLKGTIYGKMLPSSVLFGKLTVEAMKYDYEKSEYVGLIIEGNPEKEKMPRKSLDNHTMITFEGNLYPAPENYREHMAIFYGDHVLKSECYHNLPRYPSNHDQTAFFRN